MRKTVRQHIRDHLLARVPGESTGEAKHETLAGQRESEWSAAFEQHMRQRLLMGRYRYGRMDRTINRNYDRMGRVEAALRLYRLTGNMEHLVDMANMCMMEFEHTEHPLAHFESVDDGIHVDRT